MGLVIPYDRLRDADWTTLDRLHKLIPEVIHRDKYGPHTYLVCSRCDYNTHICPGCGEELTHAEDHPDRHYKEYHSDDEG